VAEKGEIDKVIMALKEDMTRDNIGLDAEWNVNIKSKLKEFEQLMIKHGQRLENVLLLMIL
jgi:hypothetical protein